MDSYEAKLKAQINAMREDLLAQGKEVHPSWVTHAICNSHRAGLAENDDAEFWHWAGYKIARDYTRREISKDRVDPENEPLLPGFKHLRQSYVIDRDGDAVEVPIFRMTDAEVDEKAAFYRAMGAACFEHADELERFKANRETVEQIGA